jgi:WD40 repeat protein
MPAGPLQRTSEASIAPCIPRLTTARASRWPVLTQALKCHASDVNSVAFSPEGQRVVSGSSDMSVRIWDILDGKQMAAPLLGHSGSVQCVAFSPDGRYIASGSSDRTVRIWDANSGVQTALLEGHADGVRSITFSPDGQRAVSGSDDQSLRIWDLDTGLQTAKLEGHTDCVNAVVICPIGDRDRLASGSDDATVRVWDMATNTQTHLLKGHSDSVCVVTFSPDGKYLVSGSADRTVRVWDVLTGSAISILTGHSSRVLSVAFTPDGRRVHSGCDEYTVRIWSDMRTSAGEELILPAGDGDVLTSAVFSPDRRRMVTGSNSGNIRIWDSTFRRSAEPTTSEPLVANSRACAVAISSDGRRVAAASTRDHAVHLWDVTSSEPRGRDGARDRLAPGTLTALDGLPIGHGEVESPVRLRELVGHTKDVLSVAFSPNARYLASGSHDMSVRIWDASTGEAFARLDGHSDSVHFVSFSPSGQHVVSVSDHSARVWEVSSSTEVAVKKLSGRLPGLVVWLDDGTVHVPTQGEWRWRVKAQLPDGPESPVVEAGVVSHNRRFKVHSLTWDQDSGWVLLKTQRRRSSAPSTTRLCWLPLERRGPSYASCSHAIFICATSGRNTVLDFSETLEALGETTGWSREG